MGGIRQIGVLVAALLAALLAAPLSVDAQTIASTAAARWTEQGKEFSTFSNTVAIAVQNQPAVIETFKLLTDGEQALTFTPSVCGGEPIVFPGDTAAATVSSLERSNQVRIGDVLFFRFAAAAANRDPSQIDTLSAVLSTSVGDREVITIYETDASSGVFVGAIQTSAVPPQPVSGDCRLSVAVGDHVSIAVGASGSDGAFPIAKTDIEVLADPFGIVFDSADGTPIDGVSVTLIDTKTGAPAKVFGDDGVTPWPSTVVTGAPVTDGAGQAHAMHPGEYRFPLTLLGSYRLTIGAPAPFVAPSLASATQLDTLRRPDGLPFTIVPASFGQALTISGPSPVRVDVPLDRPAAKLAITKVASRANALPGDAVSYTVTLRNPDRYYAQRGVVLVDRPGTDLRLRRDSIRVDGQEPKSGVTVAANGREFSIALGDIAPGGSHSVTYAMTIRPDAAAGQVGNVVTASDALGAAVSASATVQIEREDIAARVTLLGRVVTGGCDAGRTGRGRTGPGQGVAGVRIMLEDGSFALTDAEGQYHFDGVVPGSHVVQAQPATLPQGSAFVDCSRSTRTAGSANSRFVFGQGGEVLVADFAVVAAAGAAASPSAHPNPSVPVKSATTKPVATKPDDRDGAAERTAAGADIDWVKLGDGPTGFLFPAVDHNPRAPAVRVVVRHRVTEKVELLVDGKPVDLVAFDGTTNGPGGTYAISVWRGIPLSGSETTLTALVRSERGALLQTLRRDVHFAATPARVELLPEKSRLIADGTTRPVVALRVLDRSGRPVHAGLSGEFELAAPYESAEALAALQSRALSGQGRGATRWLVQGDDGIAYVELAPTMVSGKLHMEFAFADGQQRRRQQLDAWVVPGAQPWTVVGLAEGSAGAVNLADDAQRSVGFESDLGRHARLAIYAKGPVAKSMLLTLAYDSAKQRDDQRPHGAIDPRAYYSVFADGSDRRFDAASREKLYLRIEGKAINALYGDFDAGFDQTQLARYARSATGLRGEFARNGLHAAGFAARIASGHRHDEFQGAGVSGPYRLSNRAIIPGSEVVSIEVRDRLRSEVIVARRTLTRFVDYDLDLLSGTITFREPVLSRDADLNPQFVVMDYELDEAARGGPVNAGLRADYTTPGGQLRIGGSAVTDTSADGASRTNMGALDLRARLGKATELRGEAGVSTNAGTSAMAWLVEAEHHSSRVDLIAYARMADRAFGVGQSAAAERGRRKLGLDARYQLSEALSLTAAAWDDTSLTDAAHRRAVQLGGLYRTPRSDLRLGVATMQDTLADLSTAGSTVLEGGATQRLLDNRLELSAASTLALGRAGSLDLPERHRFSLRYAVRSNVRMVGSYEIARGQQLDARTVRAGIELTPWQGGRITTGLGQQQASGSGKSAFAAFGLTQAFPVSRHLTLDATLDGSRLLGPLDPARSVNLAHPPASGGTLGAGGSLAEDYTAVSIGANWRDDRWSVTGRGEWRDASQVDNAGLRVGVIRQLGEGTMLGSAITWTRAKAAAGAGTSTLNGALALARRPAQSTVALLAKFELRADRANNAVAGQVGPLGGTAMTVNGNARSTRVIGSVALDWSPRQNDDQGRSDDQRASRRSEVSVFGAVRYNLDRVEGFDIAGTTLLAGIDARYGIDPHLEIGARATVRASIAGGGTSFSFGPQLGFSPARDVLLIAGYNVRGYRDRDFSAAQFTDGGLYASVRFKFDANTFAFLGLGQ